MFLLAVLLILLSTSTSAETSYTFQEPSCPPELCGSGWIIYIDGEIRSNEGEFLENEIIKRGIPQYSAVYLNSPGGSLYGGMELGRVIRKYGFSTSVGLSQNPNDSNVSSGICFSACTFAYLGGKFRYFSDSSIFGVHRFYSSEPSPDAEATAQIASADIISYLREIGIESSFFVEMTKASSDSLRALPHAKLTEMGIVNNGIGATTWSIQATEAAAGPSILYARGERETSFGVNKAIFVCGPTGQNISMYVIFDPQGREQEALAMRAYSLLVDAEQFRLTERLNGDVELVNGWINATFNLSAEHWLAIKNSETLGVAFQFSFEAPVFLGFSGMPLEGARNFLAGIESACPAAYSSPPKGPSENPVSAPFQRFIDQDFIGDDLMTQGIRDVDVNQCEAICANSQQCLAYSYVERLNWCFPKRGIGNPVFATGVTSGVKE